MKKILCLFFVAAAINSQAQICFGTPKVWNVSNTMTMLPSYITSADFTNDGKPDFVTGNVNNPYVTLLVQQPGPGFSSQDFYSGSTPEGVTSADFDHDGLMDVAVANFSNNSISILLGNGVGAFPTMNTITTVNSPQYLATSDFNNDNHPDLVVSSHTGVSIYVLMNDGTGQFMAPVAYTVNGSPTYVSIADFNQDGKPDLAVGLGIGIDVMLGLGGINFATPVTYSGQGWDIAIGDFNADGKLDMAGSPKQGANIDVYLGDGTGVFGTATTFTTATDANSVTAGDFNNDGKLDLSVTHQSPTSQLTILQGDGAGNFSVARTYSAPFIDPRKSLAVDIDQDGKMDLAVADAQDQMITLLQSVPPTVGATATASVVCQGSSVTLSGTGASSYSWSNGVTDGTAFTPTTTVNYTVTGTDGYGCTGTDTITVATLNLPNVTAASTSTYVCSGHQVTLTGGGASSYTWSGGASNGVPFTVNTAQTFTVTGTAANTCTNSASVTVNTAPSPMAPDICEVTVDSLSINNLIYWDKTLYPSADSFYIYRDTANYNYVKIGAIPHSAVSMYIDTARHICQTVNGDPLITYYKYKLAYRDTCGTVSPMSMYHQSVYMYHSAGLFQWNHYEIEGQSVPVPGLTQYKLMRDNYATGTYTLAAGASASSTLISDPNYSTYQLTADWRIETQWNIVCTPTARYANNNVEGTIVKSKSNISNNRTTGVKQSNLDKFAIYPNPANSFVTFESGSKENYLLQIMDMKGAVLMTEKFTGGATIDVSTLPAGIYNLRVVGNGTTAQRKLAIVR